MKHALCYIIPLVIICGCSFLDATKDSSSCNLTDASCASINKKLDTVNCVCIDKNTNYPTQTCGLSEASCSSLNKILDTVNCVCIDKDTSNPSKTCELTEASCSSLNKILDAQNCICIENDGSDVSNPPCNLSEAACHSENKRLDATKCICIDNPDNQNHLCLTENFEHTEASCNALHKILNEEKCICVSSSTCQKSEADCYDINKKLNPLKCSSEDKSASIAIGDLIFFGHLEQDGDISNGNESIAWRVLDVQSDKILVLSDLILDVAPYDKENRTDQGVTWETSRIRSWLNGYIDSWYEYGEYDYDLDKKENLYDRAFSAEEKDKIIESIVSPHSNPKATTRDQGNETHDKLFLLSTYEVQKYITDESCIALTTPMFWRHPPISACGQSVWSDGIEYKMPCAYGWMLRTIGSGSYAGVEFTTKCLLIADGVGRGLKWSSGIRPAMWLKLPLD